MVKKRKEKKQRSLAGGHVFVENEWKEMVEFRGISPARQPRAIHVVPDTMPKTHSGFSTRILFARAL